VETYEDSSKLLEGLTVEGVAKGDVGTGWRWEKMYPVERIPGAPSHLPKDVEAFYVEAVGCLVSGYPNAAGAMLRKTLEAATRTDSIARRVPPERQDKYKAAMLSARLKVLCEAHIIPESLFKLVDTINLEGNEAVHGMKTYTKLEAEALKEFLDAFLQFVFTFPKKLQSVRSAAAKMGVREQ
jgi:hypothetical protein